eukprot:105824-Chlamydomonas_euryale.AAC.5
MAFWGGGCSPAAEGLGTLCPSYQRGRVVRRLDTVRRPHKRTAWSCLARRRGSVTCLAHAYALAAYE